MGKRLAWQRIYWGLWAAFILTAALIMPHGVFSGRFDPLDIAAFAIGIGICYVCDRWDLLARPGASAESVPRPHR